MSHTFDPPPGTSSGTPTGTPTVTPTVTSTGSGATGTGATTDGDSRSLGEIFSAVTEDLSTLIRQEIDLAKTEMKQEITKAGKGAGLLGGAGLAGYFLLLFLSATLMFGLDEFMHLWIAALIVAAIWGIAAAVLGLMGKKKLDEANPQLPKTQQTLKEDAQWAKAQKS